MKREQRADRRVFYLVTPHGPVCLEDMYERAIPQGFHVARWEKKCCLEVGSG